MPPKPKYRYYEKQDRFWSKKSLDKALEEVAAGKSVNATAKKYLMSESKLRVENNRRLAREKGEDVEARGYSGRNRFLSDEVEQDIAALVRAFARNGMGIYKKEVGELIMEFCEKHELNVWEGKGPGKKFIIQFCDRHNLTLRKETMLSVGREEATKNPWIIGDFYTRLRSCLDDLIAAGVPEDEIAGRLWNADETSFAYDRKTVPVLGGSGEERPGTRAGEGRKNTSVLACASANGQVYPPLVVFSLMNQPPDSILDDCMDGMKVTISKKGWMTKKIFEAWFKEFCGRITERPLLLLYDGHCSHVSLDVLVRARDNNITLLKLPPHTTDLLQPLDVIPFASLKMAWNEKLRVWNQQQRVVSQPGRAEFCRFLSDLWVDHFKPDLIVSAFEKCGIWPLNHLKYPATRFDKKLLKKFQKWVSEGAPPMTDDEYHNYVTALSPKKAPNPERSLSPGDAGPSTSSKAVSTSSKGRRSLAVDVDCHGSVPPKPTGPPVPYSDSPGPEFEAAWELKWFPVWRQKGQKSLTTPPPQRPASALTPEERTEAATQAILDRKFGKTPEAPMKKRKFAEITTSPEFIERRRELEAKTAAREAKKSANEVTKKKEKPTAQKVKGAAANVSSDSSEDEPFSVHDSSEAEVEYPPRNDSDARIYLRWVWHMLKPPNDEDGLKGQYYALVYYRDEGRKKPIMFIGKLERRFLADKDGLPQSFIFKCLDPTPLPGGIYRWPKEEDRDTFPPWDIVDGPLEVRMLKDLQIEINNFDDVKATFNACKGVDRKSLAIRMGYAEDPPPLGIAVAGSSEEH